MLDKRLEAWEIAENTPMPTTSDEPWRRTDLRRIRWDEITNFDGDAPASLDAVPGELVHPLIGDKQGGLIVFVNGKPVHAELAAEIAEQGVIFTDLSTAVNEHPDLVQKHFMTEGVPATDDKFAALHGALWTHGVFLYVPKGKHIELPFHSVEYVDGHVTTSTHIMAVLEENSSMTYLHESVSEPGDDDLLHMGVIELLTGPASNIRFVRLQNWAENVLSFENQRARVRRDAQVDWVVSELGTKLSKVFTTLDLDEDNTWGRISGLYFTHDDQHLDLDTQQNHHALHNTSDLLYKGGLKGESRVVWQGMILVDPGAQKTDGFQVNRNIIIDDAARADSIPGLEIQADDVACTHAAATGQIEEEHIFYLMARGIPRVEAERMIIHGFFDDVMQRIPFEEVRDRITDLIDEKLRR